MNRFRELERFPKILLIALVLLVVVFAPIYGITASRVGYLHNGEIFVPRQSEGALVYEGQVDGRDGTIIVALDTVIVNWGSKTYGPYTLRYDPTAVPEEEDAAAHMTGIEILDNGKVCFRGGMLEVSAGLVLYGEDGSFHFDHIVTYAYTENTDKTELYRPQPYTILELLNDPPLQARGEKQAWFIGLLVSLITAVSILFADELFYLSICFRVQNAETAEPSDWAIASRNIGWGLMVLVVLWIYLLGLQ